MQWQQEQAEWSKRRLAGKEYVYLWVDGLGLNSRIPPWIEQKDVLCGR